ncbi:MAG: 3'-5' exonuclease [Microbacter sp.]
MDFQPTISKESLQTLPVAAFPGEIRIVDRPDQIEAAVQFLRQQPIIGFDTETKPNFSRTVNHAVALVQLSTEDVCYLFRLNIIGMPVALIELLNDSKVLKIGLSLRDDFRALSPRAVISQHGFVELQSFVKRMGIEETGLTKLFAIIFGQRISKSKRLSNWEANPLTEAQQLYAATDAWACYKIYTHLIQYDS